ncbi:sugar MFS transporter [Alishewanella sp. SMS8]|uniref:sugar MFS transporter n=1 Tax=unclassified Alishewanella TaxID=2628974 RepID=UPI002742897C|nr:sugar MFS transporter [Alishewanella sp. SMS8]MDP4945341.1 sugar MFS transporter [Alishewanella sp.]MDP5205757.1 sugar MFS transporter [Alishewanella sp. SMS9]MDP5035740.1 sugar MFS transporter [Alishewanella sp.]MDP5186860.1 sugar MFS transporter [Alishewanella sp.]MDP5459185.1 sugar MFS transporter [Alishewanella sp. SMS8]
MAASPLSNPAETHMQNNPGNYRFALTALTTLFFMWGFITCLNDILIPYLKQLFDLSYTQAMLIQFCFFSAYFIVSVPAGILVGRIGYQAGIVTGLLIAGAGCLLFYPAAEMHVYGLFLLALFVLASGITILQVAANPYVSALGRAETASSRLTMTQAFNSLGTTVAPFFGAWLIFGGKDAPAPTATEVTESTVQLPYLLLAASLVVLAIIFVWLKLPAMGKKAPSAAVPLQGSAWKQRHLVLGAVGIFVYVGAEVSIGSFLAIYLSLPEIGNMTTAAASHYISWYFGGAMVGRFIGAAVMQKVDAGKALAFNAIAAVLLLALTMLSEGQLAMWSLLFIGLCNSIMFPTIFSLAINGLKHMTSQGSGILCLAIVGGAILPLAQGALADRIGVQPAFILPLLCYIYIAYYGLIGSKPQVVTDAAKD